MEKAFLNSPFFLNHKFKKKKIVEIKMINHVWMLLRKECDLQREDIIIPLQGRMRDTPNYLHQRCILVFRIFIVSDIRLYGSCLQPNTCF